MHAISISDISEIYGITQLASSICHMLDLGDNGTSTWQWDYHTDMLPLTFHFLDMWTNFRLAVYGFNDFYKTEYISIHCKPERDGRGARFSPVFIEVNPLATGIHCEYSIVMTGSPVDGKALRGQQTWAQPLGWPLSHRVCWVVSEIVQGYHS